MITKQQLAQKRNYFKFYLSGLHRPIDLSILTAEERIKFARLNFLIKSLKDEFNINSHIKGLNVPEHKCWDLGCKNKVIDLYKDTSEYTCKKHSKI